MAYYSRSFSSRFASSNVMAHVWRSRVVAADPLNLDVPPSLYWEARGKTCPLFVPGCRCGLGKAPILGGAFEGAQGSLVDPVARPLILREEPALPPWCFYREPPFGQHLPTEPEDDPFLLPPSPTIPSSRESSPLPDPGLDPVESQADVADAAVEESAAPIESITCYCGRPDSVENMIACGTDPHPGEAHDGGLAWFHQSCAGLEQVPAEDEDWYCVDCQPEVEADIARRAGSGSKRLPGASSPTPQPQVQDGEESLDPRPRKAESLGPERPQKRRASGATKGHGAPTFAAPRLAKRKADDAEYESPQKKYKIGTDQRGARMPQLTNTGVQAAPSSAHCRGRPWSAAEEAATIAIMKDLVAGTNAVYGDKRWEVCAKRLKKDHGLTRSGPAIKNHWNRVLRARTGLDERRTPNPNKMVTGLLTPRKKQRTGLNSFSRPALSDVPEEDEDGGRGRNEEQDDEEEEEEDEDEDEAEEEAEEITAEEGRAQKQVDWDNETYVPSRKRKLRGGAEY